MAIYSLNVATVGKSTHASGTAGAHLLYIAREGAATHVEAEHMPAGPQAARAWMDNHEREARSNARLMTKVRIALPRELDRAANAALAREFIRGMTASRVPAFFAIHDQGADAANPHAHIVLIDRDVQTGKRVLMLSDSPRDRLKAGLPENGVAFIREQWEHRANQALAAAGLDARIDRRSLEAQGIDRTPQIHVGPSAQHIDGQVARPESRPLPAPTKRHPERVIDYPAIDQGRTRQERNAEIIDLNLERAARSPSFETRAWALFEKAQRQKDRLIESRITAAARQRTKEERRARQDATAQLRTVRARTDASVRLARDWLREHQAPMVETLKARHAAERANLAQQQERLFARFFAAVDLTGRTRHKREAARMALVAKHRTEREALSAQLRQDRRTRAHDLETRHRAELAKVQQDRTTTRQTMRDRHEGERRQDDRLLQTRAAERERDRATVQAQIAAMKRGQDQEAPALSRVADDWASKDDRADGLGERGKALLEKMERAARERERTRHLRRTRD